MLTKLLSAATCATCQKCCIFESYDIWNTPVLLPEDRKKASIFLPDAEFISISTEAWKFRIDLKEQQEEFQCPLLDPDKGCLLGEEKPFDCQIWPFRLTELEGRQAITMASYCEAMAAHSLQTLLAFLRAGAGDQMFAYAEQHPAVIHPYDDLYPVLLWKPLKF